jgi:hypothetical protein
VGGGGGGYLAAGRASTRVGASPPRCRRLRPERRPTARAARAAGAAGAAHAARTLHSFRVCPGRLEQQGLHKEAMRHMTRALKINTKAFGEEHASTKDTASNLGRLRGGGG